MLKNASKLQIIITEMEKGKNLHQLLLRTQKFTPKVRDSQQSKFFTPLLITLSTRIFTPVGNYLHQQRL